MVLLWMAEGFLQQSSSQSMEMVGAECFNGLLKRSFFVPVDNSRFEMHDLMYDLAEYVSGQVCFRFESVFPRTSEIPKRTRHLLLDGDGDNALNLDVMLRMLRTNRLRTFYLIHSASRHRYAELAVVLDRQQMLRVLLLSDFRHDELPATIGNLKYLRHLDVSRSELKRLPESMCTLYSLQTLILTKCSSLLMLPQGIVKLVHLQRLHIKGAGLEKMPEEMGRLRSLQILTNFIVGNGGSSIKELGALTNLHGSLSISNLQNVSSVLDASAAKLTAMQYLDDLELIWSSRPEYSADDEDRAARQERVRWNLKERMLENLKQEGENRKQEGVLENLQPSGELKKLSVQHYDGTVFPKWLGDSSSLNITSLHLGFRRNIKLLPPLGQLSLLEHLIIERLNGIRCIDREFYGEGCKPFQSLKTLEFKLMSRWEKWNTLEAEHEEFARLEEFRITCCHKFSGDLPKSLPNLTLLSIDHCPMLNAFPWTPRHCRRSLNNNCRTVKREDPKPPGRLEKPLSESRIGPSEGKALQEDPEPSGRLEEPLIESRISLSEGKALQEDPEPSGRLEEPLIESHIDPSKERTVQEDPETDSQSRRIEREACSELPEGILERSLQHLYIIDCIRLEGFPSSPSLKTLYIHNCKSLKSPPPNKKFELLEDLCLGSSCDSLEIFPLDYFPKLESLSLWDCGNLKYLSVAELRTELTSLVALEIKNCPQFTSFSREKFQAPNLTSLVFFNCGSLTSLPWMHGFKSLRSLYLNKCPALESLPEEGLPSSLVILCVSFCDKLPLQKGWKLDELDSLSHFEIEGGCQNLESFPEEGLLPTKLNSLRISKLSNLISLDGKGLENLASLQTLEINCCNELDSLPALRLPSSLSSLSITDCSKLNSKLQNRKGKEWFKIAHIPYIHLDEVSD